MRIDSEDWEKIKQYAQEITTYDLMRQEIDYLKGKIRDLEDDIEDINRWIELQDAPSYTIPNSERSYFEATNNQDLNTVEDLVIKWFNTLTPEKKNRILQNIWK